MIFPIFISFYKFKYYMHKWTVYSIVLQRANNTSLESRLESNNSLSPGTVHNQSKSCPVYLDPQQFKTLSSGQNTNIPPFQYLEGAPKPSIVSVLYTPGVQDYNMSLRYFVDEVS